MTIIKNPGLLYLLIIIALVILCIGAILSIFIYEYIDTKLHTLAYNKLSRSIKLFCDRNNIEVSYHDDLDNSASAIKYNIINDDIETISDVNIRIQKDFINSPLLIAQGIGYYLELIDGHERTDNNVNMRALSFCESVLSKLEQKVLKIELNVYFRSELTSDQP